MIFKNLKTHDFKFEDNKRTFSGYASKFDLVDAYGDTIFKGAYTETLKNRKRPIRMRWNHYGPIIGKYLKIEEDEIGLWVEGELTKNHSVANDVYASLKHGAIEGLSIGYYDIKSEDNETGGKDLHEIELIEISPVEEPADLGAKISTVKSYIESLDSLKEIESFIRDECRLSQNATKALISKIKNSRDGCNSMHRDDVIINCSGIVLDI